MTNMGSKTETTSTANNKNDDNDQQSETKTNTTGNKSTNEDQTETGNTSSKSSSVESSIIRACLLYEYKQGNSAASAARRICIAFGEDAISQRCAQRWYKRFSAGDESLKDERRSGRPHLIVEIEPMQKAIEMNPKVTPTELSRLFQVSNETIRNNIKQKLSKIWKGGKWVAFKPYKRKKKNDDASKTNETNAEDTKKKQKRKKKSSSESVSKANSINNTSMANNNKKRKKKDSKESGIQGSTTTTTIERLGPISSMVGENSIGSAEPFDMDNGNGNQDFLAIAQAALLHHQQQQQTHHHPGPHHSHHPHQLQPLLPPLSHLHQPQLTTLSSHNIQQHIHEPQIMIKDELPDDSGNNSGNKSNNNNNNNSSDQRQSFVPPSQTSRDQIAQQQQHLSPLPHQLHQLHTQQMSIQHPTAPPPPPPPCQFMTPTTVSTNSPRNETATLNNPQPTQQWPSQVQPPPHY